MAPVLLWLIMVLCLLVSVVKYVMGIILKVSFPSAKVQKDFGYQPTVSVLMPCFNEGNTVYETIESISKSNYPSRKIRSHSAGRLFGGRQLRVDAQGTTRFHRHTHTDGAAMRRTAERRARFAMRCSTPRAEMIISIDSDCIFHPDAIRELTACFSEPHIGSVGGSVGVRNPNDSVITAIQADRFTTRLSSSTRFPRIGRAASAASVDACSRSGATCCWRLSQRFARGIGLAFQ